MHADHRTRYEIEQFLGGPVERAAHGEVVKQRWTRQNNEPRLLSSSGATGGTGPEELPKVTIMPRGRRQSSDPVNVSLPTES